MLQQEPEVERLQEWLTPEAVKRMADKPLAEVREKFYAYRKYMRPTMKWNWWTMYVALQLQEFYEDFKAGKRPQMAIMAPPQHGKSWTAEDFIAWVSGNDPNLKTIFASYSDDLGMRTNLSLQRTFTSEKFKRAFPMLYTSSYGWTCNTSLIEFVNHTGSFRNTTVEGAINGLELNLGVIDDPVKGRAEAMSLVTRERVWHWFADDWGARFAANSAMLIVMTRWHVDDILGRYLEKFPNTRIVRFPAIAEEDEYIDDPKVGKFKARDKGVALFPAVKPIRFLLDRKHVMTAASWESEYQQNPIIAGGGLLPIEKLRILPLWDRTGIKKSVRYWDKAGTADGDGAYTAGVLIHEMQNKTFVIEHVVRGRWSALDREDKILAWAEADRRALKGPYEVGVEQEPGSGGKESAEASLRNLRGFRCYADKVTGSKEVRCEPFAAQVQAGNVWMVAGDWIHVYLQEAETFPNGKTKDMIDASSGAFIRLTSKPAYNLDALAS